MPKSSPTAPAHTHENSLKEAGQLPRGTVKASKHAREKPRRASGKRGAIVRAGTDWNMPKISPAQTGLSEQMPRGIVLGCQREA